MRRVLERLPAGPSSLEGFSSAHFCRNIGFVKECEEVLIIDGGAVVLAVGLGGEG